ITMGRSVKISNLRAPDSLLRQMGVTFFETNRGGDITYHGPGQLVGYPILNLGEIRRDVAWYVRSLEEVMIRATADFGVASKRVPGCTGVWVDVPRGRSASSQTEPKEVEKVKDEEKIGAIGVHISRWVTSHGFAYNVSTDLRYFDLIVPCGIAGKRATSLDKVLGRSVDTRQASSRIAAHFGEVFDLAPRAGAREELDALAPHENEQPAGISA
ncbi:MAG TPA: lipoyl(octanoyl) transferase LipB, partial [Verrucomicrobiae bacterium]|nr:lipoyl(octanoyl) transferase LipB [Verrucomicrobiae bacterium]